MTIVGQFVCVLKMDVVFFFPYGRCFNENLMQITYHLDRRQFITSHGRERRKSHNIYREENDRKNMNICRVYRKQCGQVTQNAYIPFTITGNSSTSYQTSHFLAFFSLYLCLWFTFLNEYMLCSILKYIQQYNQYFTFKEFNNKPIAFQHHAEKKKKRLHPYTCSFFLSFSQYFQRPYRSRKRPATVLSVKYQQKEAETPTATGSQSIKKPDALQTLVSSSRSASKKGFRR